MPGLTDLLNEIPTFLKLAWLGWLAWGVVQIGCYRRARVIAAMPECPSDGLPTAQLEPASEPTQLDGGLAPALDEPIPTSCAAAISLSEASLRPQSVAVKAKAPKRRRRAAAGCSPRVAVPPMWSAKDCAFAGSAFASSQPQPGPRSR
jgi:hypothetical protein